MLTYAVEKAEWAGCSFVNQIQSLLSSFSQLTAIHIYMEDVRHAKFVILFGKMIFLSLLHLLSCISCKYRWTLFKSAGLQKVKVAYPSI